MSFTTDRGPASETAIAATEAAIGAQLPPAYRAFLRTHDGGRPKDASFVVPGGRVSMVGDFATTEPGHVDYLLRGLQWHDQTYPKGFWPIAEVGNGDQIVIAVEGPRTGQILFYFHDRDAPEPIAEASNLTHLADDFDAFAAMQRPEVD